MWNVEYGQRQYRLKKKQALMGETLVQTYRNLRVWQEAMDLVEACYRTTKAFPKEELYGMTAQIRQAAVSIPANIAEGYGRKNRREYIRFLYIAQGYLKELETHLLIARRIKLSSTQTINPLLIHSESVGRLLLVLIRALENK